MVEKANLGRGQACVRLTTPSSRQLRLHCRTAVAYIAKKAALKYFVHPQPLSDSKLNATEFPKLFATEKKSRDIIVLLLE